MKKIITVSGSPGSGKSTLCMNLSQTLSSMGETVFYAHEWVKEWANRKMNITPVDQYTIFGNQVGLIASGIASEAEYVTCCTSPELCAFYAAYGSGFDGRFNSLIQASKEFEQECVRFGYATKKIFLYRTPELYKKYHKSVGRWHGLEESIKMQDTMAEWLVSNFSNIEVKQDIEVFSLLSDIMEKE